MATAGWLSERVVRVELWSFSSQAEYSGARRESSRATTPIPLRVGGDHGALSSLRLILGPKLEVSPVEVCSPAPIPLCGLCAMLFPISRTNYGTLRKRPIITP